MSKFPMFMRFPGGLRKAVTLSYDDGVEQDAQLIEILNRNGLKATFNLNSGLFAPEGTKYPTGQIHRRMLLLKRRHYLSIPAMRGQCTASHTLP